MSYLDHECPKCGHQAMAHKGTCTFSGCPCKVGDPNAFKAEPRIYKTFDSVTGKEIDTLTRPGDPVFYGNQFTCDCPACHEAWKGAT